MLSLLEEKRKTQFVEILKIFQSFFKATFGSKQQTHNKLVFLCIYIPQQAITCPMNTNEKWNNTVLKLETPLCFYFITPRFELNEFVFQYLPFVLLAQGSHVFLRLAQSKWYNAQSLVYSTKMSSVFSRKFANINDKLYIYIWKAIAFLCVFFMF